MHQYGLEFLRLECSNLGFWDTGHSRAARGVGVCLPLALLGLGFRAGPPASAPWTLAGQADITAARPRESLGLKPLPPGSREGEAASRGVAGRKPGRV